MGPESRCGPRPQIGNSLACAEFDRRAALAAVDSRGVELGDSTVVAGCISKRIAVSVLWRAQGALARY